jgi:2-haloalkanoic acid dehalogenase type II
MPTPRPTLITLDLDDTLWPCAPVIAEAEAEHYRWLERRARAVTAAHDLESLRRHRIATARSQPHLAHDFTALRLESLRQLLVHHGHPGHWAEQATAVFLRARDRVTPYPEVSQVLEVLTRHYTLVSVTNGNADVHQTALGKHFHFALTAAAVGAAKPAPDMFEQALTHAGAVAERAVHVGDDPWLDVEAARAVGMGTVWVNREAKPWPVELAPPDVVVEDLRQFLLWLQRDEAVPGAAGGDR